VLLLLLQPTDISPARVSPTIPVSARVLISVMVVSPFKAKKMGFLRAPAVRPGER
jgi:hypothetical protein